MGEFNIEIVKILIRRGIYSTVEMSETIEREHGITIKPHIISEYMFRARRADIM